MLGHIALPYLAMLKNHAQYMTDPLIKCDEIRGFLAVLNYSHLPIKRAYFAKKKYVPA